MTLGSWWLGSINQVIHTNLRANTANCDIVVFASVTSRRTQRQTGAINNIDN
ncbi:hypothetical protein SAMN05421880_12827 [Nitrosomonas nitrosa]|uniref:Uncharacterized protein n=1 Tax=Nitrosomonas nitrosa TaxID=52442 RepID=A0A1I4T222_9PROT|nr:hypothetical protein SAMN05421880_12827 [Nitrosomonas nitrosa]